MITLTDKGKYVFSGLTEQGKFVIDGLTETGNVVITPIIANNILTLLDSISVTDDVIQTNGQLSLELNDVIVTSDYLNLTNPNAPTLIGSINYKGLRQLNIYLKGVIKWVWTIFHPSILEIHRTL